MPNKIPELDLQPKSDRELLVMTVQNVNFLTQVQVPEIINGMRVAVTRIDANEKRINKNESCIREVKYKAGINGSEITKGQKLKLTAESKSGIFALLVMAIYKAGTTFGWWA